VHPDIIFPAVEPFFFQRFIRLSASAVSPLHPVSSGSPAYIQRFTRLYPALFCWYSLCCRVFCSSTSPLRPRHGGGDRSLVCCKRPAERLGGGAELAAASEAQSQAIASGLEALQIEVGDAVVLAEKVGQVPWATSRDKQNVLDVLTRRSQGRRQQRVKQQNFESIGNFFSAREWRSLLDPALEFLAKATLILDRLIALGCRNPTEGTMGYAPALLLICTEGPDRAKNLSPGYMHDTLEHLKNMRRSRTRGPALETFLELPVSAAAFEQQHPRTYAAVFPHELPIECQVRYSDLAALRHGMILRNRQRSGGRSSALGQQQDMQSMMQMMMMNFMGHMQQGQGFQGERLPNGANLHIGRQPRGLRGALDASAAAAANTAALALSDTPPPTPTPASALPPAAEIPEPEEAKAEEREESNTEEPALPLEPVKITQDNTKLTLSCDILALSCVILAKITQDNTR